MSNLNRNVPYMIFEKLQVDKNTLDPCLLVMKLVVKQYSNFMGKFLKKENEVLLLSVIISHLSNYQEIK